MGSYSELVRGAVIQAREKQKEIERHTVFTMRHDSGGVDSVRTGSHAHIDK